MTVRATPFHCRAAESNRLNAWEPRNGWTLASFYDDANAEALAARLTAAFADVSWRWRVMIEGPRAEEFLARLLTKDPARLAPGQALKALWLSDKGAVRGAGALARHGAQSFQLVASAADSGWIARGAALFDVTTREIDEQEGGLAIVGPTCAQVVEAAGLDGTLEMLSFRKLFWRGLDVTLSRFGEHGGYELWCRQEDAPLVWDRVAKAGAPFALEPAGLKAMDVADLEAGVPRPLRDYEPASDGYAAAPTPWELGLDSLVDTDHALFNGRAAALAAPRTRTRVGIELDDERPAPFAVLSRGQEIVGRTLGSLYSPALQGAIALGLVNTDAGAPGTELTVLGRKARVAALPFLPACDPIKA